MLKMHPVIICYKYDCCKNEKSTLPKVKAIHL